MSFQSCLSFTHRIKWCGLQKHQPDLIPNIMRKYGVTITFHENMILLRDTSNSAQVHLARNELEQSLSNCFIASILHPLSPSLLTTLKGTIGHDVTVYNEEGLENSQFICGMSETRVRQVKEIVDHPFIKEVHVSTPVMESLKIKCVRDIKKIEQECMVDISYRGKKVLLKGYTERKVHTATRKVQDKVKALKYTKKNLNCPPAISAYVHHRLFEQQLSQADNEFLSSLQTKVFTENNQVWLEGSDIEKDEQKLLEYLAPKKLQHQQFHFNSDSRFVPQIENTLLCDLHKKHCFTHLISLQIERPDTPRRNYRTSSRSSLDSDYQPRPRISSRNEEGFTITIYSSNDEDFKHVSSFLKV